MNRDSLRRAAPALAAAAGVALLLGFPLYHRLGVSRDVLRWGPVTAWGPETSAQPGDGAPVLRFGEATREDQGVTFLLQHSRTRRFELDGLQQLSMTATCEPAPCTVELRALAAPDDEHSWPWMVFGEEPTTQGVSVSSFSPALAEKGCVAVIVARTESVRKRDGSPRTRTLRVSRLEFR